MPTRREKQKQVKARARKKQQRRWLIGGGVAAVIVLVVAGGVAAFGMLNPARPAPVAAAAAVVNNASCSGIQTFPILGNTHIQPGEPHPAYNSDPPTNGWHWANPQDWGIYTTPQIQEQLVHNLEHGGIVIQYNGISAADVQRLTTLVQNDSHHMILAPYPGMPAGFKVAFTAWGHLQTCGGVDENAIRAFTQLYRDQGPESVP